MKKIILILVALFAVCSFAACEADQKVEAPTSGECVHQFGKWSITKEATCTSAGTQSRECELCSFAETSVLPQLGHTEVIDPAVEATCTTDGKTEGKHCSVCNIVLVARKTIHASHSYDSGRIVKETSCKEAGVKEYTCTVCNDLLEESIPAIAHKYDAGQITREASCKDAGIKLFTCTVCGHSYEKSIPKIAHTYDSGVITTAATCESGGVKTFTCTVCKTTNVTTIAKLGHTPNNNYVCTRCGKTCPVELSMTSAEKTAASSVHWISQRQIWHQDDEGRYVLVFSLLDKSEKELSAPAVVEIKIKNDKGEIVYSAIRTVKSSDYSTWYYNNGAVKKYQATVYINDNELTEGLVDSGDIYFTVYNTGYFSFDESSLSISDLPVKPTKIILPTVPTTIHDYSYSGKIDSSVKITSITYEISGDDVYFYFAGEKTYDSNGSNYSQSCKVGWKLYDEEGFTVASGTLYSTSISVGEKFRNEKEYALDVIEPGSTYTLVIMNVD